MSKISLKKSFLITISLLLTTILIVYLGRVSEVATEQIYSNGIFLAFSRVFGFITNLIPLSLIELVYISLVAIIPYYIYKSIKNAKLLLYAPIATTAACFGFALLCMPNYTRLPLEAQYPFSVRHYTTEELYQTAEFLISEINEISEKVNRDENGVFISQSFSALSHQSIDIFNEYTNENTYLPKVYSKPKPIIFSELMSYFKITGFYSPYTAEANINKNAPNSSIPATMLHELAHTAGIMKEEEANFLAYISGRDSEVLEFQYSSYMLALIHTMNSLYSHDYEKFEELYSSYSPQLITDLQYRSAYWTKYDTPVAEVSNTVNDTYLKINKQDQGTKSYGLVTDLIIAEYLFSRHDIK